MNALSCFFFLNRHTDEERLTFDACLYTERKSRYLIKVGVVELLSEYGLFLAKIVTVVVAIIVIVLLIVNAAQRKRQRGELRVTNLSEQYQEMKDDLAAALMDGHQQKLWHKAQKKKA
nr:putative protease sohB [Salmonella sp. NCTC 7297]